MIDLKLTTSGGNGTATNVDLTIGSKTRTVSYTTFAAVIPATIAPHGFTHNAGPSATLSADFTFEDGIALIVVSGSEPASVSVGGMPRR